jgi:hypothetical protein
MTRAMQAHRLWIKLWISLGHPAENRRQPGGNATVTRQRRLPAHSLRTLRTPATHSACARSHGLSPARTPVIPSIHRPYDDYQTSYVRQLNTHVGLSERSQPPKEEGDR